MGGECASKTRGLKPRAPRHALGIETRDWNGHFFDQQKFWRWRLPLYFMTFIIFVKDVVTFGSFKSIDSDEHENEFRLAKQLYTLMRLQLSDVFHCCHRRYCSKSPGVGHTWELLVEVFRPVLQILTLFQTKKCHFSRPFSVLALKKFFHYYLD